MKKLLIVMAIWVGTIGLAGAQTFETAAPPPLIPYSGTISDASGEPVVGLVSAMFALYDEPDGGVPLWVDIQPVLTDAAGGYLVLLGAATELPVELFATHQALWLGVQPEGYPEQPRVRFYSVPYALKARDADTLGGRPLSEFVLLSGENGDVWSGGSATGGDSLSTASSGDLVSTSSAVGAFDPTLTITGDSAGTGLDVAQFQIKGSASANKQLRIGYDTTSGYGWIQSVEQTVGQKALSLNPDGGNVGIGTRTPGSKLQVSANGVGTGVNRAQIQITGLTNANKQLRVGYDTTSGYGWIQSVEQTVGQKVLSLNPDGGNVGIGTTSPTARLHVVGDIIVGGNIAAKYQDVAEWVEAVGAPTPGMVVVADPLGRNRVRVAEGPYDTGVLGAVSFQPGVVLGEPGPNSVLVAQSGRVRVKVDASYGAITPGDLLSTSPTPGHAMRSDPFTLGELSLHSPGTVLGKALEPLRAGLGEILVLITLQ